MVENCQAIWNQNSINLESSTDEIQMYTVRKMVPTPSSSNSSVRFSFLLERIYVSYLMTTFGPCIVLCGLGSVTMIAFELDNFTDRITITLSLLIVVASLFSQMVSTIPTSPSMKYVEMFFFYIILRLAYVFVIHTLVMINLKWTKTERTHTNKLAVMPPDPVNTKKDLKPNAWINPKTEESNKCDAKGYKLNKVGWILGFVLDFIFIVCSVVYVLHSRYMMNKNYFIS